MPKWRCGIGTCESTNDFLGCPRGHLVFTGQKEKTEITFFFVISAFYGLFWISCWCRRGDSKFSALSVLITHCNTIQYFNKIKKLGRVVFLYRCGTVKSTITDLIFRFPLTSFLGFPVQNPPPLLRPIPLPRTRKPPAY